MFLVAFATEEVMAQQAQGRPSWLAYKWDSWQFVVTGKDPNSSDYYSIKIGIKHTNNSSNRDLKAIYKKKLTFSATVTKDYVSSFDATGKIQYLYLYKNGGKYVKKTITSDKVNNVNVWPGNSYTLYYFIPLNSLVTPSYNWAMINNSITKSKLSPKALFKDAKIEYYDCYVR